MKSNQVVCAKCNYFEIGINKVQGGPVCMYEPPKVQMINITIDGRTQGQQIISYRPIILEPEKEYCSKGFGPLLKISPMIDPTAVGETAKSDNIKDVFNLSTGLGAEDGNKSD